MDSHPDVQVDDPSTLAARAANGMASPGGRSSGRRATAGDAGDASAHGGASGDHSPSARGGTVQADRVAKAEKMQAAGLTLNLAELELEELSIALRRPEFRCARVLNRLHTSLLRVVLEDVEGNLEERTKHHHRGGAGGGGGGGGGHSLVLEAAEGGKAGSATSKAPKLALLSPLTWPHHLG